jgi:hypothetical protein
MVILSYTHKSEDVQKESLQELLLLLLVISLIGEESLGHMLKHLGSLLT